MEINAILLPSLSPFLPICLSPFQGSIEEKIFQRQVSKQGLSAVVDHRSSGATQSGTGSVQFSLEDLKVQKHNISSVCIT